MNKFWKIIYCLISVINAISCIVLLFVICPRVINHENLEFDYVGVIVGILSLLVTVLLGWNIFYALELKKDMLSKLEEKDKQWKNKLRLHSELNQKDFNNIIETLKRSEEYSKNLDNCLLELMKMYKSQETKK